MTAPAVIPDTIKRWKISASTSGGRTASTPPAFISVGEVDVSVTNPAMMIGIVLELSDEVNSSAFDTRLAEALASESVMMRDTPDGLRYLVRRRDGVERATVARGGHSIRSVIGGVLVDPNITRPLGK